MAIRSNLILLIVALTSIVGAKVASTSLAELEKSSSLVVVAHVKRIDPVGGFRVAFADVESVHRGYLQSKTLQFLAEPTWTCDSSSAKVGETVLLYLISRSDVRTDWANRPFLEPGAMSKSKKSLTKAFDAVAKTGGSLYVIAHSGYGRIPLLRHDREWRARATRSEMINGWAIGLINLPKGIKVETKGANNAEVPLRSLLPAALPKQR